MESVRSVTRNYNKMLKMVETDSYFDPKKERINCYKCDKCKGVTKTEDKDVGTTPFMITCTHCKIGMAKSTFYNDIAPEEKVRKIWYRPSLKECLKLRKHPMALEHIYKGGLLDKNVYEGVKIK